MSHVLQFHNHSSPPTIHSPPYVVFGIYGTDVTSSLPPLIPLKLVLHFAPALRKWLLPALDPAYLPPAVARHALRKPYIGINILAPIDAVGLGWIVTSMLHHSGLAPREYFLVHPDLATSLAIHNAWLALDLPVQGLRNLHTHIHAQLLLGSSAVCLWDIRMLWDTFPHDSEIVKAMGLNFVHAHVNVEYAIKDSLEIQAWFRSTPESYAFFKYLKDLVPEYREAEPTQVPAAEEKEKVIGTGYQTIGRKAGKVIKADIAAQNVGQVDIMEKGRTRKVNLQERKAREANDYEALRARLNRTRSDDSLRSVDTTIWDPQTPEEGEDQVEDEEMMSDDANENADYYGGSISAALARSLETIRSRREARLAKHKPSLQSPTEESTSANLDLYDADIQATKVERLRHRRSSNSMTTGKAHSLSFADLDKRVKNLKEKLDNLAHGTDKGVQIQIEASTSVQALE